MYAEETLGIEDLLLRQDLLTEAGRIFLGRYGELIDLSNSGQLAVRKVLEAHLRRVEWDPARLPLRFYPFVTADGIGEERTIALDPRLKFGRPVVQRAVVSTQAPQDSTPLSCSMRWRTITACTTSGSDTNPTNSRQWPRSPSQSFRTRRPESHASLAVFGAGRLRLVRAPPLALSRRTLSGNRGSEAT
jgi:hypothetical protein